MPLLARKLFVRVGVLPDGEAPDDCDEEVLRELVEPVEHPNRDGELRDGNRAE